MEKHLMGMRELKFYSDMGISELEVKAALLDYEKFVKFDESRIGKVFGYKSRASGNRRVFISGWFHGNQIK